MTTVSLLHCIHNDKYDGEGDHDKHSSCWIQRHKHNYVKKTKTKKQHLNGVVGHPPL